MSNPSVCFLSSTVIEGMNFRIEDNLGEAIHIHIGKIRIALSVEDYFLFAEGVMRAAKALFQIRGIELETLDEESLKGEWLANYNKIESVQMKYVELESLYMKESYVRNRAIKRFIPLKESGYIKVIEGDKSDIEYYKEPGKLQPSRIEKMDYINRKIRQAGYPWDNKLIFVNQEGYIYDGVKRASCLYALYGGSKKIPVLCIHLPQKKDINEQIREAESKVQTWNMVHPNDRGIQKKEVREKEIVELKELIKCLNQMKYSFFMIKRDRKNAKGELLSIATIIVEEGTLNIIKENLNIEHRSASPYDDYQFLYTASKPLCYLTDDGPVLIFDQLCCKNKFEKYILPVDRYVVKKSWENIVWDDKWQCYCAKENIYILMILTDALLECGYFKQEDIDFIECHEDVLYQQDFRVMVEKEFYHYAPQLIKYLTLGRYDDAISMYERFADY